MCCCVVVVVVVVVWHSGGVVGVVGVSDCRLQHSFSTASELQSFSTASLSSDKDANSSCQSVTLPVNSSVLSRGACLLFTVYCLPPPAYVHRDGGSRVRG